MQPQPWQVRLVSPDARDCQSEAVRCLVARRFGEHSSHRKLLRDGISITSKVPLPLTLTTHADERVERAKARFEKRSSHRSKSSHCVIADVARFYPSIYTHSIAWAFEGKARA